MLDVAPDALAACAVAGLTIECIARAVTATATNDCRRTVTDTVIRRGCLRGCRWREHATAAAQLRLETALASQMCVPSHRLLVQWPP